MIEYCKTCGTTYVPGESQFCSKCGKKLPGLNISKELSSMEQSVRKDYDALKFTASMLVLLGWITLALSWISGIMIYSALNWVSTAIPLENTGVWLGLGISLSGTILSVFMMASGQMIFVLLDIRNDARITSKLTRLIFTSTVGQDEVQK